MPCAFAMLLGIALHAALSFADTPWIVGDKSKSESLKVFFEIVHGFRMPLFFLVSGYFTMMLWRRRGLSSLLEQRFQRVLFPCLLGLFAIVPLVNFVSAWAMETAPRIASTAPTTKAPLIDAIKKRDATEVEKLLAGGVDPNKPDPDFSATPLGWAVYFGDAKIAKLLLDGGVDPNAPSDKEGYRPLHGACFFGRKEVVALLLERGADTSIKGKANDTARDSAAAPWEAAKFIAGFLKVPIGTEQEMNDGRAECIELLDKHEAAKDGTGGVWESLNLQIKTKRQDYRELLSSRKWEVRYSFQQPPFNFVRTPYFAHLWFLWFLCWLVVLFGLGAKLVQYLPIPRLPGILVLSRFRILWLIPLTLIPQLFMGVFGSGFGPDTATGVIPEPHLLVYYGLFFGVGALYFDGDDRVGKLGSWWWIWFLVAGVAFPLAQQTLGQPLLSGALQVLFAWAMIFGCIGLFRRVLNREYRWVRYLSDSAYWLYLAHLPLVLFLQAWIRDWDAPALVKFSGVTAVSTAVLLVSYHFLVRPTYLGTILNGPKKGKVAKGS